MIGKHKIIGICASEIHSDYPRDIILSVFRHIENENYRIMIFNSYNSLYYDNDDTRGEASIFSLVPTEIPDVMIILPESLQNRDIAGAVIKRMRDNNVPVICIDGEYDDCINLTFRYVDSFERIVRHIVEDHGCRSINFIAGVRDNAFSEERVECFRKVLRDNGIEPEEGRIDYGDFWSGPTVAAMERFMASGMTMPQAIICANDSMAITVCRYLKNKGIRVPEDVLVTGFDGIELEKYTTPRLTTAEMDIELLGERVGRAVDDIFSGQDTDNDIGIPYHVRISQSCGCVPVDQSAHSETILQMHDKMKSTSYHEDHIFHYLEKATKCGTEEELADMMANYADYDYWCCLNTDYISYDDRLARYADHYTESMKLFLGKSGDETEKGTGFPVAELLPDIEKVLENNRAIMFCPVHFHADVYGYICVGVHDRFPFENTRRFLFNTNLIIENFRQQRLLKLANAELDMMQMTDSMTGLYNRRGFYKKAGTVFSDVENGACAVIFSVDMDSLKYINDTFGHKEGDRAIKTVADTLREAAPEAVVARFGGDEFAVLLASAEPDERIAQFSETVERTLDEFNQSSGLQYIVHTSMGSAVMHGCTSKDIIDEYLKTADREMYEHKQQYKKTLNG